jgi:alpha-beta hydrolase superfamily lysophospholipase
MTARATAGTVLAASLMLSLTGCAVRVPRTVAVRFPGPAGTINGAIYLPDGPGPHPGVVLVHGAVRNSYTDFVQEARFFAAHGIAALAYDTRGTGGSAGDRTQARFEHLAHDALAAVRCLRGRAGVDSERVGLWGFDQGGWIAPLAASRDTTIAFVVLVSTPLTTPLEQFSARRVEELVARGTDRDDAEALVRLRERSWKYWGAPSGTGTAASDSLRRAFEAVRGRPWFAPAVEARDLPEQLPPDEGMGMVNHPARWWLRENLPAFWSLRYEPVSVLAAVRAPMLAVYGSEDREVRVEVSGRRFRRAVGRRFGRDALTRLIPGADHTLHTQQGSGLLRKLVVAPGYRDSVIAWVGATTRASAPRVNPTP